MFHNLRINIFVYYILTTTGFIFITYYFIDILGIENIYFLFIVLICIIILSGVLISKLAIDPLRDYVEQLQSLSKETLHELNLPVSTITTNTQMLSKNIQDEKNLKRIYRIESACIMLHERYNELNYLIKMQTEQNVKEFFFLDEILKERISFLERLYPHMKFNLDLSSFELFADKTGMKKVIDNLIDNGVKYSGDSKNINIVLKEKVLSIEDFGIGMDEVEIVHIFDKYYQTNKDMQGFGIGLNLVKRFCDKNKIELTFESLKNSGTIVKLKFK